MLTARFVLAAVLLGGLWMARSRERIQLRDAGLFVLLGIMQPGLYFVCETEGLLRTSASVASLIIASIPVFVAVLASIFLRERISTRGAVGIGLTLVGVALLVKNGSEAPGAVVSSLAGNLLVLGAALCASIYTIVSRSLGARYGSLTVTTLQAFCALLFFLPFAVAEWDGRWIKGVSTEALAAVIFLGLFASLLAFLLYNQGLRSLPASTVSVFINLIPVVTVLTAFVVLGERLSVGQIGGGCLVVAGVVLSSRGRQTATGRGRAKEWLKAVSKRGTAYRGLALGAAEQHIEGAAAPVPGAGGGKGEHEPL
ncbi:Permease of the drug/metabolite transporter (DMT) superfamily [Desulfacinum hydrothermale DSM 13146]|uniref:Permease of the drug/metabolite transporter (DMT) superfamily n=2 Tax=Desulfacinum hydrothermale TaxID=109258 RepID=A0A1W1XUN1_9BACT|nr:Permease of the drug/metabolite transporter (DMT) superfamily [Desulfacinum hydrothermale DSM 13146]